MNFRGEIVQELTFERPVALIILVLFCLVEDLCGLHNERLVSTIRVLVVLESLIIVKKKVASTNVKLVEHGILCS